LASGRLTELKGPGGWGAKFQTFQTHIQASVGRQDPVEKTEVLSDAEAIQVLTGPVQELSTLIANLDPGSPSVFILEVGRPHHYKIEAIVQYLKALIAVGAPAYVVFVDTKSGKFIGSTSANQLSAFLANDWAAKEFIAKLEGQPRMFTGLGFLVTDSLTSDDTNFTALQKFVGTHSDALVIIEDRRKPIGVVDRNRLMTKLLLKLAS
jgi:electron transfer flavoprotein alpha subunit